MDVPDVRYARAGGVAVAYQVVGDGERTLVFAPHLCDIFSLWRTPYVRRFLDGLAEELRLVVFNARGTGLSDRPRVVTLEARMDDIGIVLDALDLARAALLGVATGGNACALFAATHPERCERLVLSSAYPRAVRSNAYPHGPTDEEYLAFMREVGARWGDRDFLEGYFRLLEPEVAERPDDAEASLWQHRLGVSPAGAVDFWRLNLETDITDVLPSIRVPTLILHGERDRGAATFLRQHIPGSEEHELHDLAGSPYSTESARAILGFLRGDVAPAVPDSVLATVMFTDLVGSTERAAALGDRAWRELLSRHHADVRSELARYRGVELDVAGDGFFCRFDGPARAIACARAIIEGARRDALEVRVGIHTGECELVGDKIAGIAVVTGARVSALARPREVLVSGTVVDLVAGSGLAFEDRGAHELKGVPGTWRLYAVVDA